MKSTTELSTGYETKTYGNGATYEGEFKEGKSMETAFTSKPMGVNMKEFGKTTG